jgi:hypothetical protein
VTRYDAKLLKHSARFMEEIGADQSGVVDGIVRRFIRLTHDHAEPQFTHLKKLGTTKNPALLRIAGLDDRHLPWEAPINKVCQLTTTIDTTIVSASPPQTAIDPILCLALEYFSNSGLYRRQRWRRIKVKWANR